MFYGTAVWDPWLIVSQIICIQCINYVSLGILLWLLVGIQVPSFTLTYFFDYTLVSLSTAIGWSLVVAFLVNSLVVAGFLYLLVERSRKCLDFSATVYMIHLFFCIAYGGLPASFTWWLLNALCLASTSLLGEWLCMKRELRDIPMRSTRTASV